MRDIVVRGKPIHNGCFNGADITSGEWSSELSDSDLGAVVAALAGGGLGGRYSGLGMRPGLGVGAPGLGWRRGLG